MALYPTRSRRLQEGDGEACGLYSQEPIDHFTVRVTLPANPHVQDHHFVNWYIGFGDPDAAGLHVEAGISYSIRRGWNAFFNPEGHRGAVYNETPQEIAKGERVVDLTLIRRQGGGRVKFFVRPHGAARTIDLTPSDAVLRANPSRVKIMSAASDVNLCSFDEVVMTVISPDWYRPMPWNFRARGARLTDANAALRIRVISDRATEAGGGFRTELPPRRH